MNIIWQDPLLGQKFLYLVSEGEQATFPSLALDLIVEATEFTLADLRTNDKIESIISNEKD